MMDFLLVWIGIAFIAGGLMCRLFDSIEREDESP